MLNATKIRIYPNKEQAEKLSNAFGCARWFWNNSLSETQRTFNETGKGISQFELNMRLPKLKKEFEWLAKPNGQSLQAVSLNLSRAFQNFFSKRSNYPRFKSKYGKQSIQFPQRVKLIDGAIQLPKIGKVKAVIHREIIGRIKTVTVSKSLSGKYYASILSETDSAIPPASLDGKVLGVDVGLIDIAVTSDGSKFSNPKHLHKAQTNLAKKQQKLSRKVKGSNSRNKARIKVARCHERIANARKDYLHKLSTRLVNENQVIAVEDLHVKGMMKNHNLARAISGAGWGMFTSMLKYKAARQGKGYIEVNRFFASSKTCSTCLHAQDKMPLNVRMWTCDKCGTQHDRDINAAINIRNEAQRMIAAGIAGTADGGFADVRRPVKSELLILEESTLEGREFPEQIYDNRTEGK